MLWENDTPTPPARPKNARRAIVRQINRRQRRPGLWARTLRTVRTECRKNTAQALFWVAVQLANVADRIGGRP